MARDRLQDAPSMVTAEFSVKLSRPTPSDQPLRVIARAVEVRDDRVAVESSVQVDDKSTATGRGVFVRVKPDHPAYGRW